MDDRPADPELDDLLSDAFEADERASLARDAAAEAWRKVVKRTEQLRREAHPPS